MNLPNKYEKFFFYPQKIFTDNAEDHKNIVEQLVDDCERLTRQCDELKVNNSSNFHYLFHFFQLLPQPETPKVSSPTAIQSSPISPFPVETRPPVIDLYYR